MCAGTRATIKQMATHGLLPGQVTARVVSSAPVPSTAAPEDYPAAGSAPLVGRYPNSADSTTVMLCIGSSSTQRPINEQIANSRCNSLPKFPITFEADNQRAQCAVFPGVFARSNGRSPP
jgi:hypothetical protein